MGCISTRRSAEVLAFSISNHMGKGKGGGSNREAIELQKESLRQSKLSAQRMEALMKQSIESAKSMKLPAFQGPAPLPRPGSQDAALGALESRRNLLRRNGLNSTSLTGA